MDTNNHYDVNRNNTSVVEGIPLIPLRTRDRYGGESPSHTVASDSDDVHPRVTINVGGGVFHTYKETFQKGMANVSGTSVYYDAIRDEYFFDRDPEIFRCVLYYWRTGHLHLPSTKCGAQIKEELEQWGLGETDIESCCWSAYHSWMRTIESLKKLERDRRPAYLQDPSKATRSSVHGRRRLALWNLLTDPSYSKPARVYAYVALVFVILAIFSFCASTHHLFQIKSSPGGPKLDNSSSATSAKGDNATSYLPSGNNITITNSSDLQKTPSSDDEEPIRKVHPALFYIDYICLAFFTLEYIIRLICAKNCCKFFWSPIAIVDLLAILPDYIELIIYIVHSDVRSPHAFLEFMPFLRLMRAFRIFRLVRRVPGLWLMMYTLKASLKELSLMLIFLVVGTILFSSIIFFVDDHEVFSSIPHSFWWAIVTMTTVGYGDMTPQTAWGQLVGSVTAVCGVLIVGFTIPALVNNFITYYNHVEFVIRKENMMLEGDLEEKQSETEHRNGQIT